MRKGGKYKIFGVGCKLEDIRMRGVTYTKMTFMGLPIYQAPEVVLNQPFEKSCDVWSLGMILYHLLFGQLPWEGKMKTLSGYFKAY